MPGAEQLLVDPELLRQTEGSQVNQSLLSFATTLRKLAQGNHAHTINHDGSVLTKLLAGMLLALALVMPDWKSPSPCKQELELCLFWGKTQLKLISAACHVSGLWLQGSCLVIDTHSIKAKWHVHVFCHTPRDRSYMHG